MTKPHTAAIIPFPTNRRSGPSIDRETLSSLHRAETAIASLSHEFDIEGENLRHGSDLSKGGGILNGRALAWACEAALHIINLRGNPDSDRALSHAIRTWLRDWRNAHG